MNKAPAAAANDKAKLLLQRERELYELRHQRSRAEEWLSALHAVWPDDLECGLEVLGQRIADLLVGALSFERAAAFEYEQERCHWVFRCSEPHALPDVLPLDSSMIQHWEANPLGYWEVGGEPKLELFAQATGLDKFFWRCCPSYRGSRLLFVAGASPRTAPFHTFPESERQHFAMFTSHAAALLSNTMLVADVRRDRAELAAANQGLDSSLRELEHTQAKLLASTQMVALASRQAGMAEVATGILHNVGNVLNSINVCSDLAAQHVAQMPIDGVLRLAALLADQTDLSAFFGTDPRAPKVIEYLQRVAQELVQKREQVASELQQLAHFLAHVGAIVSRQQEYAKSGTAGRCSMAQVVEDALLLTRASQQEGDVEVVKLFEEVPEVHTDRHRVLQIVVNLMSNALQAVVDGNAGMPRIVASIRRVEGARVRIMVEDNGIGIQAEHLQKLFRHGFTTRAEGHGFGLHNSALTAQELGGVLRCASEGKGKGARFWLDLPIDEPTDSPHRTGRSLRAIAEG